MGLINFIIDQNRRAKAEEFAKTLPQAFPDATPADMALMQYGQTNPDDLPKVLDALQQNALLRKQQGALAQLFAQPEQPSQSNTPMAYQAPQSQGPQQLESGGALVSVPPTTADVPYDPNTMQVSSLAQYGQPKQPDPQAEQQARMAKTLPYLPPTIQSEVVKQMMVNSGLGMNGLPGNPELTGEEYLKTLPKPLENATRALLDGRAPYQTVTSRTPPLQAMAIRAAQQADPTYNANTAQVRTQVAKSYSPGGTNGQVLQSIGTASGHLADLQEAYDKLKNSGYSDVNKLANYAARKNYLPDKARNKEIQEALGQFDTALNAVAPELAKISSGNPVVPEGEINKRRDAFSSSASPSDFNAAMKEAASLIKSRSDSMLETYQQTMGGNLPVTAPKYSQRVLNHFRDLGVELNNSDVGSSENNAESEQPQQSPQERKKLEAPQRRVVKFSDLK